MRLPDLMADEGGDFGSGRLVDAIQTSSGGGDRHRVGLLDTADGHTEMLRFDHHEHTDRLEFVFERGGDLTGELLLHLQPLREAVDKTGQLGKSGEAAGASRQVCNVGNTAEGQQVVLAHGRKRDVPDEHDFIVVNIKGAAEVLGRVFLHALEQFGPHLGDTTGRILQAFPIRVFADRNEEFSHSSLSAGQINSRTCRGYVGHE